MSDIMEMNAEDFKEKYQKSKVISDLSTVLHALTSKQLRDMYHAHKCVQAYTGLDMKQEYLVGMLKSMLE